MEATESIAETASGSSSLAEMGLAAVTNAGIKRGRTKAASVDGTKTSIRIMWLRCATSGYAAAGPAAVRASKFGSMFEGAFPADDATRLQHGVRLSMYLLYRDRAGEACGG